jgi:hypothetical protein
MGSGPITVLGAKGAAPSVADVADAIKGLGLLSGE